MLIHLDAKMADADVATARHLIPRADFVEPRHRITWSGWNMVEAELTLLEHAVTLTAADDHVVLLSGADYPLRPIAEFERFLASARHRQHIRAFSLATASRLERRHVRQYWWMDQLLPWRQVDRLFRRGLNETVGRLVLRRPPNAPVHGLTWWAITGACAAAVLQVVRESPELRRFYRHTWCPDELFVHGIVHGSPYGRETRDGGPMPYPGYGQWLVTNFHLIDPALTRVYSIEDLPAVAASDQFFVRKVSTPVSSGLLDWLDEQRGIPLL